MQVRALQVLRMDRTSVQQRVGGRTAVHHPLCVLKNRRTSVQQRVGARTFAKSLTKSAGLSVASHGTPVRSIAGAALATSHVQKI